MNIYICVSIYIFSIQAWHNVFFLMLFAKVLVWYIYKILFMNTVFICVIVTADWLRGLVLEGQWGTQRAGTQVLGPRVQGGHRTSGAITNCCRNSLTRHIPSLITRTAQSLLFPLSYFYLFTFLSLLGFLYEESRRPSAWEVRPWSALLPITESCHLCVVRSRSLWSGTGFRSGVVSTESKRHRAQSLSML